MKRTSKRDEIEKWLEQKGIRTTNDVDVPKDLMSQVIGQDEAVEVARKAAEQRRHLLLIGDPGTGKSMIARSMTEFLPPEELEDVLVYPNQEDPNEPRIRIVPAGKGSEITKAAKNQAQLNKERKSSLKYLIVILIIIGAGAYFLLVDSNPLILLVAAMGVVAVLFMSRFLSMSKKTDELIPKLLVSHEKVGEAPFIDATGAHAGALLGDVKHDPFQSGGLETPPHDRVEVGSIHKANKGVLFIDEINLLRPESQQSLLTAMQEKRFSIFGQSERSAGAMVKTEAAPCDFILVAAGNLDSVYGQKGSDGQRYGGMHPALRSRIRGYGYEVYVKSTFDDTPENRLKLVRFIAQEIKKDGKIPHFKAEAIAEVIREAQRRSGVRGQLSLRFRELGGLVRAGGDIAKERRHRLVNLGDIQTGKLISRSLEQQVADREIDKRKEYIEISSKGSRVGVVNGLAVLLGDESLQEMSGIVTRVAAEITPASSKQEGRIIATGRLGEIARESVQNVSALIKTLTGKDISNYDVHIQFMDSQGVDGDSASISIATAVISALEEIPVNLEVAMTGSISVRGDVLPVGGVSAKIEAAAKSGLKRVIIPKANQKDVILDDRFRELVEVIPVSDIREVLDIALVKHTKSESLLQRLTKMLPKGSDLFPGPPEPSIG
ncbi:MAG: ATP-dependent protease LonB [Candidatus Thermoplasmatota archaeon]|nr:ATP-dependent protease LonB [Candidatus Thermoplasmatota archaeon]